MTRYRLSVEIETDQDPSELLAALDEFAQDLPENCYPEGGVVVEDSVTVEKLSSDVVRGAYEKVDLHKALEKAKVLREEIKAIRRVVEE